MRVSIERNALVRLLGSVTKVVESRTTLPILGNVKLVATANSLTATATDLDIEATASVPVLDSQPGGTTVSAKLLEDIAKKLPASASILLELKDNTLAVSAGRSRFSLQTLPASDFPAFSQGDYAAEFETDLAALFAPAKFAIANDVNRFYLEGIYMHVVDGKLTAVATDGHRLSKHVGDEAPEFAGVIVPRKTVGLVPAGAIKVAVSGAKIRFTAGDIVITSKLIDGTFPDYPRVIPSGNDRIVTVDGKELAAAVDRVSAVFAEKDRRLKLSIGAEGIELTAGSEDVAQEAVSAEYGGETFNIGFQATYVLDVLANLPAGEVRLEMDPVGPCLVKSDNAQDQTIVLMPMRV